MYNCQQTIYNIFHNLKEVIFMNDILLRTFKLLNEQRLEQKDLAEAINVKPQVISDWKSGKTKSYTKYIDQIASFFGVSVDYLLGKSPVRHNTMEILRTDSSSYVPVPVVGNVAAGYTALAETDIIGYELVDSSKYF